MLKKFTKGGMKLLKGLKIIYFRFITMRRRQKHQNQMKNLRLKMNKQILKTYQIQKVTNLQEKEILQLRRQRFDEIAKKEKKISVELGNNSEKLKNEIRQLLQSLYRSKKLTKQLYKSLGDNI